MQIKRIGILAISLAFVFTSVVFAGETLVWTDEHSDVNAANPEWGIGMVNGDMKPESDRGVRGYYGPEQEDVEISSESDRPLGFPLDRHPQLDVYFPPAGHPPYGPGD